MVIFRDEKDVLRFHRWEDWTALISDRARYRAIRSGNPRGAVTIFVLAAVIASSITDVFRCCIDTIFVCSFKDMEEHNPPKFMPSSMRSSFGLDESVKGQTEPTLEKKGSSTQGV